MNIFTIISFNKKIAAKMLLNSIIFFMLVAPCLAVLTITLDKTTIDFETMAAKDFKEIPSSGYYNKISVVSDTGSVWQLKIKVSSPLTNSNLPTVTIPNEQFRWMSTYAGNQNSPYQNLTAGLNHKPANGYTNFSLVDELVYTSEQEITFNDNNNSPAGTEIQFKYAIAMPDNQVAGTYNAAVVYTVTQ